MSDKLPITDMSIEQLEQEIKSFGYLDSQAAASSLQCPMGYFDNCDYNYYQSLKTELKKRLKELEKTKELDTWLL